MAVQHAGSQILSGGTNNTVSGTDSVVAGGNHNDVNGNHCVVCGGSGNDLTMTQVNSGIGESAIVGGTNSDIHGKWSFIGGGNENLVDNSWYSGVVAGRRNKVAINTENVAGAGYTGMGFIGGGEDNKITDTYGALVGGGIKNEVTVVSNHSAIVGGELNTITGAEHSAIVGGENNDVTGDHSTVVGGENNQATQPHAFVGGGLNNVLTGAFSALTGGSGNSITSQYSAIPGGRSNRCQADNSVAMGHGAKTVMVAQVAQAASGFVLQGDAQTSVLVARGAINAKSVWTEIYLGANNRILMHANEAYALKATVLIIPDSGAPEAQVVEYRAIVRKVGAANPVITEIEKTVWGGGAAVDVQVTAHDADELKFQVMNTGMASTWTRACARIELVQLIGTP